MTLQQETTERLRRGEITMELAYLPDDIIQAVGRVCIKAAPEVVWRMLADYDHLHETMPKVTSSELIEDHGDMKVIEQTGRSGFLIFERSVRFRLRVQEHYPIRLSFEQIEGDFKVYEGSWELETLECNGGGRCTLLTYEARIKPDFFAPSFLVSFVQSQDMPVILQAVRAYCEKEEEETRKAAHP